MIMPVVRPVPAPVNPSHMQKMRHRADAIVVTDPAYRPVFERISNLLSVNEANWDA